VHARLGRQTPTTVQVAGDVYPPVVAPGALGRLLICQPRQEAAPRPAAANSLGTVLRPRVVSTDLHRVDSDKGGLGVFDVDPGRFPGDKTTMTFTCYHTPAATASNPYPARVEFDGFTATRTRSDGFGFRQRDSK
jgi:hypothetical protein